MAVVVEPEILDLWLHDGQEIAPIDVREAGQFGQSHLYSAIPVSYSVLEQRIVSLAPRRSVRLVLIDEDGALAERAAKRLEQLGYSSVHVLAGGMRAWREKGYPVFAGVHVPSKAFGEFVSHELNTPSVSAAELADKLRKRENIIVLDGRPFDEYRRMSIPGARCCPNGELGLRVRDLVPDRATTIIVNCAGRTRSIIGAQTLIDIGVDNPVFSLENGTQGWFLNDFQLAHDASDIFSADVSPEAAQWSEGAAARLAGATGIRYLSWSEVAEWMADPSRSTFLCDVRTAEEYRAGTRDGAIHAPGGQLIQATDHYIGVRGGRIILFDSESVRAPIVAVWLHRMGWEVAVLADCASERMMPAPVRAHAPGMPEITVRQLADALDRNEVAVVDLRPSMEYRKKSIAGSKWSIRSRLRADMAALTLSVVLLVPNAAVGACAWAELTEAQRRQVRILWDSPDLWREPGLALQQTPDDPSDAECIDFLFFVHDRHSGNKAAAREYIAWELGLVDRMDARDLARFRLTAQ